jgi:cobalt/nickel transport system permease protein
MHIPNGFLTDPVCTVSTLASATALGVGFARASRCDRGASGALMAATGAGIFAAQMVNFPIEAGTSGHVLGAALAAVLLGPWRGMLTMATVVTVQCLLFGDGGTSALGANVLNMAVIGTLVASLVYETITRFATGTTGKLVGAAAASFASVLAAATLCSIELTISGTHDFSEVLLAMLAVHAVIGAGESLITVAILTAVLTTTRAKQPASSRRIAVIGLALAAAVAVFVAPLASTAPDGLERVADELQIASLATANAWAMAPDYAMPGISWPLLAAGLAGTVGVCFVFAVTYLLSRTATARVRKH